MYIDGAKLQLVLSERLREIKPDLDTLEVRGALIRAWEDVVQPVIDAANSDRQPTLPSTGPTIPCGSDIAHQSGGELPRHLGGRRSVFGR